MAAWEKAGESSMTEYVTSMGDTWDLVAYKVYGDEKYAEYLMAQNQSLELLETVVFDAGTTLSTPALPSTVQGNNAAPPWRAS